jgi:hypothetical protein
MTLREAISAALSHLPPLEDTTNSAWEKILAYLASGYKLADVVDDVIAEQRLVSDNGILLTDETGQRLRAIAGTRTSDPVQAARIADLAAARLVTKLSRRYILTIVKNLENDEHRGNRAKSSLEDLGDSVSDGYVRFRGPAAAGRPETPLVVLERRLELIYGNGGHAPHEMIAFGFNVHLQQKPEEIVCDLGQIPLSALARALFDQYCNTVGRDVGHLLGSLKKLADSPGPDERMNHYWDPCATIRQWVGTIRERRPPGELLIGPFLECEPPARRIVWLLTEGLLYDDAEIVAVYRNWTLEELAVHFNREYAKRNSLDSEEVRRHFDPVLCLRSESPSPLGDYFDPRRVVSDWVRNVLRRIHRAEARETAHGLEMLMSAYKKFEPHEILAFLFVQCLGESPEDFAAARKHTGLATLKDECESGFVARFEANAEERKILDEAFKKLAQRLLLDGDRPILHCGDLAIPLMHRVCAWRARLFKALPCSLVSGQVSPLFAWRCNLLPDGLLKTAERGGR